MNNIILKSLIILHCCTIAVCQNKSDQNPPALDQSFTPPAIQELKLTKHPWFGHMPDNYLSWAKVSQNHKRYRLALDKDFKLPKLRPFQFSKPELYFLIVVDKKSKEGSPLRLLAMYATDRKKRDYQPYWITCNHDLSRTTLYNSDMGVVTIEYLEAGGHRASVLRWDAERKAFTCVEVGSPSLVFAVD